MKLRATKKAIENNITKATDEDIKKAYIKDMEPTAEQKLLQAQKAKYLDYISSKIQTWQSDFLVSMKTKLMDGQTLTPNMEAALDKCIARDNEFEAKKNLPKDAEPTRKITCKMRQWWIKEHKIDSRVISGMILAESAKAYLVKGTADMVEDCTYCARCGRPLTEPASMLVGFGAECCSKLGIEYPADILTATKKERLAVRKQILKVLHNQEFEAWVPKSQIDELIAIEEVKPVAEAKKPRAKAAKV